MDNTFTEGFHHSPESKAKKTLRIIGWVFVGLVFIVLFALAFGFLVKWIWNLLMPDLFGLKQITYWQAFGMVVLAKLLFGAFGSHHHDHRNKHAGPFGDWHDRFKLCGDEPWNRRNRHSKGFQQYWQEEGKSAFEAYMGNKERKEEGEGGGGTSE